MQRNDFDELIAIQKIKAQATLDEKNKKIREDYAAFERDVELLKEFQKKHYPYESNLTDYLASKETFNAIRNDSNPNNFYNKPRNEIAMLLSALVELSRNIAQAPPSLKLSLCITLYSAIKLSESLILTIENKTTDKIKFLSNTIQKANAFTLDHLNSSHRSALINATNEMVNNICLTFSIYPENRLNVELLAFTGVLAGMAIAILGPFLLLPVTSLAISATFIGVFMAISSFFSLIHLTESVEQPEETLAYNVGRQLDLISKPFLFFAKRQKNSTIVVEDNDNDHIPLSHFLPHHAGG
jgi:hypothetical protein